MGKSVFTSDRLRFLRTLLAKQDGAHPVRLVLDGNELRELLAAWDAVRFAEVALREAADPGALDVELPAHVLARLLRVKHEDAKAVEAFTRVLAAKYTGKVIWRDESGPAPAGAVSPAMIRADVEAWLKGWFARKGEA